MALEEIQNAAREIVRRGAAMALTGAGVSVESGIPDFRSAGGIWTRFDPMEYATIDAFLANPRKVWRFLLELGELLATARPNPAHVALADLERAGALRGIATQNVDALHQAAGSRHVFELHGTHSRLRCVRCRAVEPVVAEVVRETVLAGAAPTCEACGGYLKPDVVLFGEELPHDAFEGAEALARESPVFLVVGTSATVYPAAALPFVARDHGALVIEVNVEPTDLTGDVAATSLLGRAGEVLPALTRDVLALLK